MTGLPPADTCHALLAALDDTTPDAIGISVKRQIPLAEGRLTAAAVQFRDWLAAGAPSEDRTLS